VSAIMTEDISRKFLSDHMFLTSSFMVYRKIKNCDKFGMTKSDKVDKIILKVPMSKYVPKNILARKVKEQIFRFKDFAHINNGKF
jgi:hypothetical protein